MSDPQTEEALPLPVTASPGTHRNSLELIRPSPAADPQECGIAGRKVSFAA